MNANLVGRIVCCVVDQNHNIPEGNAVIFSTEDSEKL